MQEDRKPMQLPADFHKKVKVDAAKLGKTMTELIIERYESSEKGN